MTDEPPTLEELAAEHGVSRERVRQIEQRAFQKVQAAMQSYGTGGKQPDLNPRLGSERVDAHAYVVDTFLRIIKLLRQAELLSWHCWRPPQRQAIG